MGERLERELKPSEYTCFNCGIPIPFGGGHTVDKEPARYSMDDPYPGYPGDPVCDNCWRNNDAE